MGWEIPHFVAVLHIHSLFGSLLNESGAMSKPVSTFWTIINSANGNLPRDFVFSLSTGVGKGVHGHQRPHTLILFGKLKELQWKPIHMLSITTDMETYEEECRFAQQQYAPVSYMYV